jgi:hypothetical protein
MICTGFELADPTPTQVLIVEQVSREFNVTFPAQDLDVHLLTGIRRIVREHPEYFVAAIELVRCIYTH